MFDTPIPCRPPPPNSIIVKKWLNALVRRWTTRTLFASRLVLMKSLERSACMSSIYVLISHLTVSRPMNTDCRKCNPPSMDPKRENVAPPLWSQTTWIQFGWVSNPTCLYNGKKNLSDYCPSCKTSNFFCLLTVEEIWWRCWWFPIAREYFLPLRFRRII